MFFLCFYGSATPMTFWRKNLSVCSENEAMTGASRYHMIENQLNTVIYDNCVNARQVSYRESTHEILDLLNQKKPILMAQCRMITPLTNEKAKNWPLG